MSHRKCAVDQDARDVFIALRERLRTSGGEFILVQMDDSGTYRIRRPSAGIGTYQGPCTVLGRLTEATDQQAIAEMMARRERGAA